jgi:small-conductance mechanosensitive channel
VETIWDAFVNAVAIWLPRVLAGLGILLIGWILAIVARALTRKVLSWTKLDERLARRGEVSAAPPLPPGVQIPGAPPPRAAVQPPVEKPASVEEIISQFVYYLILFMAFLGALNALGMTEIAAWFTSMFNTIFAFLPRIIYAIGLAGLAWIVARLLKALTTRALVRVGVDKRVSDSAEMTAEAPVSSAIGEAVYWLVWLLFLPAILGVLGLEGILVPIQAMLTTLLGVLPSLLAAAIIIIVGLFIARILQRITASALHAFGLDALGERVGVSKYLGKANLSGLLGYIVYIIVLVPVVIAALNVTGLTYLAQPLSDMLNQILLAIPKVFVAAAVLTIAFFLGRVFGDLVTTLLTNAGFDNLIARMSLGQVSETPRVSPSKTVGWLVMAAFMLFGSLAAASLVGWTAMVAILGVFIAFLGRLILGLVVLVLGIYLANLASNFIMNTGLAQRRVVAMLARVAIIVFATAMALDQIGIANDIVNLAFGLILAGAVLAAALAFGLGGKDVAKYQLVRMYKSAEASLAETSSPEDALPDATLPAATLPNVTLPDATLPDATLPDATLPSEPEDSTGNQGMP